MVEMFPLRRRGDLIVRVVSDETLVYDERNDRAHCLNRAAALVWEHCDGRTAVEEIAAVLHRELGISSDADVVRLALRKLDKARLLEPVSEPDPATRSVSRRELAKRLGLAAGMAVGLPLVLSIVAPTPLMAASCFKKGQRCDQGENPVCCPGSTCNGTICV